MSKDRLSEKTKKQLAEMAKKQGVPKWYSLNKDELVNSLASLALKSGKVKSKKTSAKSKTNSKTPRSKRPSETKVQIDRDHQSNGVGHLEPAHNLIQELPEKYGKDRIVLMVRDPHWLHCYWEITKKTVDRARTALGREWHGATPVLRLYNVASQDDATNFEAHVRDIELQPGCNNWYIDVDESPCVYRVDIGYATKSGKFHALAHSNVVATPRAGVSDLVDEKWGDGQFDYEKMYAMSGGFNPNAGSLELKQLFEERLQRPIGSPVTSGFGSGASQWGKAREFRFDLDAELVVYGSTDPKATVTLQGEPIHLRPDGSFSVRFRLPDCRQIIPAVATSHDGVEERTIVLSIERNTRHLEPYIHCSDDES